MSPLTLAASYSLVSAVNRSRSLSFFRHLAQVHPEYRPREQQCATTKSAGRQGLPTSSCHCSRGHSIKNALISYAQCFNRYRPYSHEAMKDFQGMKRLKIEFMERIRGYNKQMKESKPKQASTSTKDTFLSHNSNA